MKRCCDNAWIRAVTSPPYEERLYCPEHDPVFKYFYSSLLEDTPSGGWYVGRFV